MLTDWATIGTCSYDLPLMAGLAWPGPASPLQASLMYARIEFRDTDTDTRPQTHDHRHTNTHTHTQTHDHSSRGL